MLCPRCAANNRDDARFCRACGAPLAAPAPAPVPPPEVAPPVAGSPADVAPDFDFATFLASMDEPTAAAAEAPPAETAPPTEAQAAAPGEAAAVAAASPDEEASVAPEAEAAEAPDVTTVPDQAAAAGESELFAEAPPSAETAATPDEEAAASEEQAPPAEAEYIAPPAEAPIPVEAEAADPTEAAPMPVEAEAAAAEPLEVTAEPPDTEPAVSTGAATEDVPLAAAAEAPAPGAAPEQPAEIAAETPAEEPAEIPLAAMAAPTEAAPRDSADVADSAAPVAAAPEPEAEPANAAEPEPEPTEAATAPLPTAGEPIAPVEVPTVPLPVLAEPPASDEPPTPLPAEAEPPAALPPFGEEAAAPQPPAESEAGMLPDEASAEEHEHSTAHLEEHEPPTPAPPVPGEPFPALQPGDMVAGRYEITQVLQTGPQRQTYLALDTQGYLRCWACGSTDNIQGEMYCTNCGAQLTGRTYRLLETPPDAPLVVLPAPLLVNQMQGVAMVMDTPTDATTGRHYLVLEDVGGLPLSAWTTAEAESTAPLSDDRLLSIVGQAADRLQELHAAGIIGCDFTAEALYVLPDDRLVLADPSACRLAGNMGDARSPSAEAPADVQRVAAALEQWYREVRPDAEPPASGDTSTLAGVLAHGREGGYRSAAEFAGAIKDLLAVLVAPRDLQLVSGRATDVGVQRQLNEDSLFALECVAMEAAGSTPMGIYVVADGMGGHDSGEVASSIAIRTLAGKLTGVVDGRLSGEQQDLDPDARGEVLRSAILEANSRITRLSRERNSDMGTTVTMALVLGNQATVANVGDSRTYLWREGKLQQITQDHSLVARLIASGQITPEEGRHFDRRNEIYRALGDPRLTPDEIDVFHVALRPLDALLLCSDGLWEMVRDEEIEQIMLDAPDPAAAAQTLIDMANHNGGEDNISVIIAQTLTNAED